MTKNASSTTRRDTHPMRRTPEREAIVPGATVPEHDHVPPCDLQFCNVCRVCGRAHHGGGITCIACRPS